MAHQLFNEIYVHQDVDPDAYGSSDGATTNGEGVSVEGYDKALCIMHVGDITTTGSVIMTVQYAATNTSTDYADISTDYLEPSVSVDSDSPNEVFLVDVDLLAAGLTGGYIRTVLTSLAAAIDMGSSILLYRGTHSGPISQENTVIES